MPTIKDALDIIGKLTVAEQESLKTMLLRPAFVKSLNIEDFVAKERFANGRVCPLCGCIHVVRNGHRKDGTQRYVCKDCGKSFVIATNSIVSGTRKDLSVWEQYIDCMMNGLSIRKTAVACGIHRNTAFLWRHKILDALQNMADDVTLDGIIEADETFFAISYKGNHSKSKTFAMPRKAHKRGHSTHIRGLSQEKVCVPCAVNRNGLSISKITNTGRARRTQPVSKCNSPVNPGCSILRGQSTLAHSPPSPSQFFTPIANVGANSFKQRSTDRARFRFFDACSCS